MTSLSIPEFLPEIYFVQKLSAYGVFVDRFGAIRRQFHVEVVGRRTEDGFILDEEFLYDDGETETRQWQIRRVETGRYEGRCADVVGMAAGQCSNNMLRWRYHFRLDMFGRKVTVHFDDVMVLHRGGIMVNRAVVSKFGLRLGEVLLTFRPA